MEFTTLEQVEQHYTPLIAAAGEDQQRVMSLRLERADAREAIRDTQDRERSLAEARAAAIRDFPYARHEELRGSNADEIRTAAQASHQHVQAILEQNRQRQQETEQQRSLDQEGRARYGSGSGAGGGEQPPPPPSAWEVAQAEHDGLMDQIVSGKPFDAREIHQKTMATAMGIIADRTVERALLDMGTAKPGQESRQHRGGVQFE